ncbi:TPT-domain-containing protein [Stipitochalara longipes BDJ]|nr:TPT-domain-containing protein [Stipitochalara longipes BDJ]
MFKAAMLPTVENEKLKLQEPAIPVIVWLYISCWIVLSSIAILFNKYLLDDLGFHFPAILTCWHLLFSTVMTQILARTTTLLDGRKTVRMTPRIYLRAIVPIGLLFSASLVCSNQSYLYLSVAFIQMLKASAPVAVLITSWAFRVASPKVRVLLNVLFIVFGVSLASLGEIKFVWLGFFFQAGGIFSEAVRLILIQILLSDSGQAMDPLVSLYYYAPVCTLMNLLVALVTEFRTFTLTSITHVGLSTLFLNAFLAFLLNASSVFLIGKTSGLVMTLCGVLKNILLVLASVLLWGTVIMPIQALGYGIALLGLVYYGVGYDGMLTYYSFSRQIVRQVWEGPEMSEKRIETVSTGTERERGGVVRKVVIVGAFTLCVVGLVTGMMMRVGQAQISEELRKATSRKGWLDLEDEMR